MAIKQHQHPCWTWRCDRCGEHPHHDEMGTPHYETQEDAVEAMREWEQDGLLTRVAGRITCSSCADNATYDVACPSCGAEAGDPCEETDRRVVLIESAHLGRVEVWLAAEDARATVQARAAEERTGEAPDA